MKFLENLHNGKGHKKQLATLSLTVLLALSGMGMSYAADTAAGNGDGVAIGTASNAPKAENVAIGKGATISYSNGASNATGDVAIGNGANINNYASQGGSVAIGKNAKVENMAGSQERIFAFGQTKWNQENFWGFYHGPAIPEDPSKAVSSIAIGDNTYARTGSVMIGPHNYNGDLGDKTVNMEEKNTLGVDVFATTIGANSYTNGAFATNTGAYNMVSGKYSGGNSDSYLASQNFGATIAGSLNSIESSTSYSSYSGIANSIVGVANRTNNSNGSLIFGAGNMITNSITDLDGTQEVADSAKKFQHNLIDSVKDAESGGAALAIGGSNTIDYAQKSQVMGVGNTLKGEDGNISKFNFIDGYKNFAEKVTNVSVLGSNNTVSEAESTQIIGDKRKVTTKDSVVIGSAKKETELTVNNATILGYNANVTTEGGVALGYGSIASTDKGVKGYDPATGTETTESGEAWVSTAAAVSIGSSGDTKVTRQITNVAAGKEDTDAVNVAQLKKVAANDTTIKADTNALSYDKEKGTLSMTVEDTKGNIATGSVPISDIKAAVDTNTKYTIAAGETTGEKGKKTQTTTITLTGDDNSTSSVEVKNDTLVKGDNGLSLNGNTLSMSVKDTAGNEVTGSVDLSGLKVTDTNTTYTLASETTGESGVSTQSTTVTVTGSDKTTSTVTVNNDTLVKGDKGLTLNGNTLSMSVKDTAGNEVKGSVDVSKLKLTDTNTTYTFESTANDDNTTTLKVTDSDGKVSTATVATKDTNTTYTLTGKENGDNTTTLTFKDSDGKSNDITVATKDTRNTLKAGDHISLAEKAQDDGSTEYTVSVKADGKVASGDTGLVTGDTVAKETRTASDGFVTKTSSTAGENILALDKQVEANTNSINNINQTVNNMGSRINKLGTRINKVGAGAAALAALHPQDFDPDDKWDVAAGYGNYKDANAAAVGAFYHPNEDTMISVGGSFGGGENMVNAGVSVKLGQGNHVTTSRVAMAREILDMKQKMEKLEAQNQYLMKRLGAAPEGALKDVNFPDVPKDHWAYQYVKTLADKGYIEGYPDGEFKGDRAMTRYEYAAVIYRALQNGAPVDDKMAKVLDEFEPELDHIQKAARFRVDRISGKDEDRGKVERVRVNNEEEERDVYGGKIPAALKK